MGKVWDVLSKYKTDRAVYYSNLGSEKRVFHDYKGAIKNFSIAIRFDPSHASYYFERGNLYAILEDYKRAIKDYSKAIEIDSQFQKAYFNRAGARYELKDLNGAIQDYSKVFELNPQYWEACFNRAGMKYDLMDYKGAIHDFSIIIDLIPDCGDAYYNRGLSYLKVSKKVEALVDLKRAGELGYEDAIVVINEIENNGFDFEKNSTIATHREQTQIDTKILDDILGGNYLKLKTTYSYKLLYIFVAALLLSGVIFVTTKIIELKKLSATMPKTYHTIIKKAVWGKSQAQYELGLLYYTGEITKQDYKNAFRWFVSSAKKGNYYAMRYLIYMYANGYYVSEDQTIAEKYRKMYLSKVIKDADAGDSEACYEYADYLFNESSLDSIKWFTKAAKLGHVQAQMWLAKFYIEASHRFSPNSQEASGFLQTGVEWFTKAAEQGNPEAQFNLGVCYTNGDGVPKDIHEAIKWYTMAAEQGDVQSQYNLGVFYYHGKGLPKNMQEAVKWWTMAAEQGDAQAQHNLGYCYSNGNGVPKNLISAYMWYNIAASRETDENIRKTMEKNRELLEKVMTPSQIQEGQRLASEWKPKGDD